MHFSDNSPGRVISSQFITRKRVLIVMYRSFNIQKHNNFFFRLRVIIAKMSFLNVKVWFLGEKVILSELQWYH